MTTPDRFWDVLVTADDGWYDFAGSIELQADYTANRMRDKLPSDGDAPAAPTISVQRPIPAGKGIIRADVVPAQLPAKGYVALPIKIGDIRRPSRDPVAARLVEWVNDTSHVGKLRINCHGEPTGGLMFMKSPQRSVDACFFRSIASWLKLHGLRNGMMSRQFCRSQGWGHGLSTITLSVCHSALPRQPSAASNEARSGVEQVAETLVEEGCDGIEVTGHVAPLSVVPSELALTNLAVEAATTTADEEMRKWALQDGADDEMTRARVADVIARGCKDVSPHKKRDLLALLKDDAISARAVLINALTEDGAAPLREKLHSGALRPGQIAARSQNFDYVQFAHHPTKTRMIR
jgi:hypothetical protein